MAFRDTQHGRVTGTAARVHRSWARLRLHMGPAMISVQRCPFDVIDIEQSQLLDDEPHCVVHPIVEIGILVEVSMPRWCSFCR